MTKRINKTKEQIVRERELTRKRNLIIDDVYPHLVSATVSINEARAFMNAASQLIIEEALLDMNEKPFSSYVKKLLKRLCPDGEREEEVRALLKTLEKEKVSVAREIIEGMVRAIDTMLLKEQQERSLVTLNAEWDKMLNV